MQTKPQKPSFLFASPFSIWTELAFKLWGFGKPTASPSAPEKKVEVAVIPTSDAQPPRPTRVARAQSPRKRTKQTGDKTRSKRAKRSSQGRLRR